MTTSLTLTGLDGPCRQFAQTLEQSRLLDDGQLTAAVEQLRLGRGKAHPIVVATELVDREWISRWQAEQLLAGRTAYCLGKYKLIEKIGSGGMGAVYKAEQMGFGRIVALKLMGQELLEKPGALDRFLREIHAAAKLQHPNIVSAFDADQVGDRYFLVLEYAEGQDLEIILQQMRTLPIHTACEIIIQAANGLQHAHERGLVHRDIKPGNLLVTRGADGRFLVKILDMGLARFTRAQEDASLTKSGQIMGTPDYMAPEQVEDTRKVDIRADIYSLGSSLFEMLTGRTPFEGGAATRRLMARLAGEAPRLRKIAPDMPAALDRIVAKALARKPEDRYSTPAELAAALAPFISESAHVIHEKDSVAPIKGSTDTQEFPAQDLHELIVAGSSGSSTELHASLDRSLEEFGSILQTLAEDAKSTLHGDELVKRAQAEANSWLWFVLAAAAVLVLAGAAFGWYVMGATQLVIDIPPEERTGSLKIDDEFMTLPAHGKVQINGRPGVRSLHMSRSGYEPIDAKLTLQRGEEKSFRPEWKPLPETARRMTWDAMDTEADAVRSLPALDPKVVDLTDRVLATRAEQFQFPDAQRTYSILSKLPSPLDSYERSSIPPGALRTPLAPAVPIVGVLGVKDSRFRYWRAIYDLNFSRDGKRLFMANYGQSSCYDLDTLQILWSCLGPLSASASSPDGKLMCFSGSGPILIRKADTGEVVSRIENGEHIQSLDFSPDGERLLGGGESGAVYVWNVKSGKLALQLPAQNNEIRTVRFNLDGSKIFSLVIAEPVVRCWDSTSGKPLYQIQARTGTILQIALHPNGEQIATSGADKNIHFWNTDTGKQVSTLPVKAPIYAFDFSPDGKRIAGVDSGYGMSLYDIPSAQELQTIPGVFYSTVFRVAFHPGGKFVAAGGGDSSLRLFRYEGDALAQIDDDLADRVIAGALSPNGRYIAGGCFNSDVLLWKTPELEPTRLKGHRFRVSSVAFAPASPILASGGYDSQIILWDLRDGSILHRLTRHTNYVYTLAFSPDGKRLASGGLDKTVRVWNVATGEIEREMQGETAAIRTIAWRPDGREIFTANSEGLFRQWDIETGSPGYQKHYEKSPLESFSFTPDGKTMMMPTYCSQQRLEIPSFRELKPFDFVQNTGASAISPNGRTAVASSIDGFLRIFDFHTGNELAKWEVSPFYGSMESVAYTANGRHMMSVGRNGTIFLFRMEPETFKP